MGASATSTPSACSTKPCKNFRTPSRVPEKFEVGKFYSVAEVDAYYEEIDEQRDDYDFMTYDEFCSTDLEVDEYTYTTPGGETIKAIAKYGYDG